LQCTAPCFLSTHGKESEKDEERENEHVFQPVQQQVGAKREPD